MLLTRRGREKAFEPSRFETYGSVGTEQEYTYSTSRTTRVLSANPKRRPNFRRSWHELHPMSISRVLIQRIFTAFLGKERIASLQENAEDSQREGQKLSSLSVPWRSPRNHLFSSFRQDNKSSFVEGADNEAFPRSAHVKTAAPFQSYKKSLEDQI